MYSLLVLGLIPGTNIQISFIAWILLALICASVISTYFLDKRIPKLHSALMAAHKTLSETAIYKYLRKYFEKYSRQAYAYLQPHLKNLQKNLQPYTKKLSAILVGQMQRLHH